MRRTGGKSVDRELDASDDQTLHLIGHHMVEPFCRYAWLQAARRRQRFEFIGVCPGVYSGLPGRVLRTLIYGGCRLTRACAAFPILPFGSPSCCFIERCGYPTDTIFPWAYFVDGPADPSPIQVNHPARLPYLGRLVARKNVPGLVAAAAGLRRTGLSFELTIVGEGPEEAAVRQSVQQHGLADRVTLRPFTPPSEVHREIAPPRRVGAPYAGRRLGRSDQRSHAIGPGSGHDRPGGAADLIHPSGAATFARPAMAPNWRRRWPSRVGDPQRLLAMCRAALAFAPRVSPEAAAAYLLRIARHALGCEPRPTAPWLEPQSSPQPTASLSAELGEGCRFRPSPVRTQPAEPETHSAHPAKEAAREQPLSQGQMAPRPVAWP